MIDRHFHWEFMAFNHADIIDSTHTNFPVYITVIGYLDEETATIAAADIIKRDNYRLTRVRECNDCGYQAKVSDALKELTR